MNFELMMINVTQRRPRRLMPTQSMAVAPRNSLHRRSASADAPAIPSPAVHRTLITTALIAATTAAAISGCGGSDDAAQTATVPPPTTIPAAPAATTREPSAAERIAIAKTAGIKESCLKISVSTAQPQWALWTGTNAASCPQGDGWVVDKKSGGRWEIVLQGGYDGSPCSAYPDLPQQVAVDLGVCKQ